MPTMSPAADRKTLQRFLIPTWIIPPTRTSWRGLIHPAFALPEGLDSLRSPVFAFIRLAE